mmetsp:Transcript_23900/g.26522  ORF Transcript_23900/g.26522 Transcript_23900/m.26522 type:complete len:153 (-) Transcript_23900:3-461(-)|eukprot:CAMPEP_0205821814 /NCGR_PEP_ID=MMETSP0206-20130828/9698_1 /ASSEMBLY_ACC=CAM_ASM_000279 /TAXON_ID=36767 /ORGANISM="Euplotes focardii, Strain TN1" /LENGTH=152 /DNA_ID=CAMNT_0053117581 /DNA_START=27 /DNA_END=485 /DNA_ORIENTATION=-
MTPVYSFLAALAMFAGFVAFVSGPVRKSPQRGTNVGIAVLAWCGGIFLGLGLHVSASPLETFLQVLPASGTLLVACLALEASARGRTRTATKWLIFGYFAHGLWDLVIHVGPFPVSMADMAQTAWYSPFCLTYDWAVALFYLTRLTKHNLED